jgi:pimeloyl-ACP methyl ester carboxylesterase
MRNDDRYIDAPGARLRVRSVGDGPALVLLHGWALDLDMWAPQFGALSDKYRLVAFDRRGFGLSSGLPDVDQDVQDLLFLFDALQIERAAVLGMSQGARVALQFALRTPQNTQCLIVDGPPRMTARPAPDEVPMETYRDLVRTVGLEGFRRAWSQHPFTRLRTKDPGAHVLLARIVARYPGADLRESEHPARAVNRSELAELQTPTLIINGAHDSAARRAAGAELKRLLPDAGSASIADAAHLPNMDNPRAYNHALHTFLQAHSVGPQPANSLLRPAVIDEIQTERRK